MNMSKPIKTIILCLTALFSMGSISQVKATLVVALDLTQSGTIIQRGVRGHGSFLQKQNELERKLRGGNLRLRGVRQVQTPHITLFSGIADTPQNRTALTNALNAVAQALNRRIYINITGLRTRGPWNGYYFYVALNTAIQQHRYGVQRQQSLSQRNLLDTIEKELLNQNVLNYNKTNADHMSLVEVHSSTGGATSDRKRQQINGEIARQASPLHYPNNFRLHLPQVGAIWINNITLYSVTRQGRVDADQNFQQLHQVHL